MESGVQSSFIPHDTVQPGRALRSSFSDLAVLISLVLFVASLVLGTGVFLYQRFLDTSSKSKVAQLERAKAAFEPALILQLTRLDDRMRDADQILANHIAPSAFFRMLEKVTLTTVAFRSLDFEAADPQNMTIKMDGVAQSVNSIALQAERFSKNGIITNPIFSNIDRELDGVHFSLTALVNPASIRYVQSRTDTDREAIAPLSPTQPGSFVPQTQTPSQPQSGPPQSP